MMKHCMTILLAIVLLIGAQACADDFYLINDSDTRYLTEEELWTWNYDALGYVLNEIFARHGYHFEEGGKYHRYFEKHDWYQESACFDTNDEILEYCMNGTEWHNERLIKNVREDMRREENKNPTGKRVEDARRRAEYGVELNFFELGWTPQRLLRVYSGPGKGYLRGADGKAAVSMGKGAIYAAGRLDNWLLIAYQDNDGVFRVGYVNEDELGYKVDVPELDLDCKPSAVSTDAAMMDGAAGLSGETVVLAAGSSVTHLASFGDMAYVETIVCGQPARGFVRADSLPTE